MAESRKTFDLRRQTGFTTIAIFSFVMLYLPIILMVVFSFNSGLALTSWSGFSLTWYVSAWHNELVQEATLRSMLIAAAATIISTTVAVLAALPMTRGKNFRGRTTIFALINQPLMVPEIVTAVALLVVFAAIKVQTGYSGIGYLILAHSAFCIPFAFMPVRARLQGMDATLEQAAADLYARPWRSFRYITFPLLWPGILAGAMLAFVTSLDDVVITEFVKSAGQDTLPTYMLGQMRRNLTPEINAISTILLVISVIMVVAFFFASREKR
ncbi:ABC transporter permease subunit [Rhizobium lusitanum]|uniref:Spermidine/putrescine transport system permease protein PotC n=1 Tax=Rhizobium lusitanum TaxID=293958 RepID=A0A6L9UE39_9HYPH|nr:ABC transporter permease [Rhizobium lusitanum]NEI73914.1 ABC transporter permease subunit [Rhizobium lusitanum]